MKVVILKPEQSIESEVPGIGIPEGKIFTEFAKDLRDHNSNPYCSAIGIPAGLLYTEPDLFFTFPAKEEHQAFLRLELCKWYYQDPAFTKPLYLIGAVSLNEIRMLSGIPNVEAIIFTADEAKELDLFLLHAAAGDLDLNDAKHYNV